MLLMGGVAAVAGAKAKPAVEVSSVQIAVTEHGLHEGKHVVVVKFDATLNKKVQKGAAFNIKAKCKVGGKLKVDTNTAMTSKLHEVEPGETIQVEAKPFILHPLDQRPENCSVAIHFGKMFGNTGAKLVEHCWTGEGTTEGACPK
ncbi:MAG TPA: hypothetical protein VGQ83_30490 [Polyangia bacterium]|jgi:hypothetical protein